MARNQQHTDGFSRRIRFGKDQRRTFPLAGARTQADADKLGDELESLARRLTAAGLAAEAALILDRFARAEQDTDRSRVRRLVDSLCSAELKIDTAKVVRAGMTFRALAARWTAGELAADFPDHVAQKKSADHDHARLEKVSAVALPDGGTFGDLPLGAVTIDHCEQVMRSLPGTAKRPATRRHYAQVLRRVLELAVYPCRLIDANPLTRNFMPKVGKTPAFSYLYPDEDLALLSSSKVPLSYRVLWGFLAREGCRVSEAIQLRVGLDVDLERGALKLDVNKTNDARTWALDPGVTRAIARWVMLSNLKAGALLFTDEFGRPHEVDKLAKRLRDHLTRAGVHRDELHNTGTNRRQLRAHDLRGTFVTMALANGENRGLGAGPDRPQVQSHGQQVPTRGADS
jgi:integrase